MTEFDWKDEILQWTDKKRNVKPFQSDLIDFFEQSFKNTSHPDKSLFGTSTSSVSLLTGGIFFAAYTTEGLIWLLLDKKITDIPNASSRIVKSTKKFSEPLYWLETEDLTNLKILTSNPEIWKSFKNATDKIFGSKMVTAYREHIAKNKLLLSEFWETDKPISPTYTPADIVWFKNVTNKVNGEAYLDLTANPFVIHFPTKHKTNVLTPSIDELILIYQKVHGVPSFTHIVTPVDNTLIEDKSREDYRYGRLVKIIAQTGKDNAIPVSSTLWNRINFSGITQGNACKLENIKGIGNIDELQLDIWKRFRTFFTPEEQKSEKITSALIKELEDTSSDLSVSEGELKLISHIVKERNRKIIAEKKRQAIKVGDLKCVICGFSFKQRFGKDFIECHHKTPISQTGVRETTLDDLALVCANCHRMLHIKFDGDFLTIEQMKGKFNE